MPHNLLDGEAKAKHVRAKRWRPVRLKHPLCHWSFRLGHCVAFKIWGAGSKSVPSQGTKSRGFPKACWSMQIQTAKQTEAYQRLGHAWRATLPWLLLNFLKQRVKTEERLTDVAVYIRKSIKRVKTAVKCQICAHLTAHRWCAQDSWGHTAFLNHYSTYSQMLYTDTTVVNRSTAKSLHSVIIFKTSSIFWQYNLLFFCKNREQIQSYLVGFFLLTFYLSLSLCAHLACFDMSDPSVSTCFAKMSIIMSELLRTAAQSETAERWRMDNYWMLTQPKKVAKTSSLTT